MAEAMGGGIREVPVTCHVLGLDDLPQDWMDRLSLVAPRYQGLVRAIRPEMARRAEFAAGFLLRQVLGVREDGDLVRGEFGKPSLARGDGSAFSLSHDDGMAVLAVANEPIGVDVEEIPASYGDPQRSALRYVLTPEELAAVDGGDDPALAFARAWTQVESVLKADGHGFAYPVRGGRLPGGWEVSSETYGGHVISCAARRPPRVVIVPHALSPDAPPPDPGAWA